MQINQTSLSMMLKNGVEKSLVRWQLLLMLAVLYGIFSSLILGPSQEATLAFFNATGEGEDITAQQAELLGESITTLLIGLLPIAFINALLLVIWARTTAKDDLLPIEGGLQKLLKRGFRCFRHIMMAALLTLVGIFVIGIIITIISAALGPLGMVIGFAGGIAMIWLVIIVQTVVNLAITHEAQDAETTLALAWHTAKPAIVPLAACLALYSFISLVLVSTVGNLIDVAFAQILPRFGMVFNGTLAFIASALHISALNKL